MTTGSRSAVPEARCSSTAAAVTRASTEYPASGTHQRRRAAEPRAAKTSETISRIITSSSALLPEPKKRITKSATGPGVSRMTPSAIATTGDSRMVSTIAAV